MAIKYYCDGCDNEVPYDRAAVAEVTVKFRGQSRIGDGTYEICKSCSDRLLKEANPKN